MALWESHWEVSATSAPAGQPVYGVAIDVGTTTVVVLLVDLATGETVSEAAALNAQVDVGDNVLTRINVCMEDKRMVGRLQEAIVRGTLGRLLGQVLKDVQAQPDQLVCMAVAGNTTMLHLVAGVDPTSMGWAPFTPTFLAHRVASADQLPWGGGDASASRAAAAPTSSSAEEPSYMPPATADIPVHLLPGAAAYIGADIIAGMLSSGMVYRSDVCMLVDVGTNGEIVLKHGQRLLACATAAGPAFEGAGLTCGVRAGKGAIADACFQRHPPDIKVRVIGRGKPTGVCGTAYVDLIAQGRRAGLIGPTGRFVEAGFGSWQVENSHRGRSLTIAHGRGHEPIRVTEADIASLLQAKAAIAAGIICLLQRAGLSSQDVTTVFLAGGFGFHMDVNNALDFGLLPGFQASQIQLVGNTSLAGAYLALLDSGVLDEMRRASGNLETIELNLDPHFEGHYIDQLVLPAGPERPEGSLEGERGG